LELSNWGAGNKASLSSPLLCVLCGLLMLRRHQERIHLGLGITRVNKRDIEEKS